MCPLFLKWPKKRSAWFNINWILIGKNLSGCLWAQLSCLTLLSFCSMTQSLLSIFPGCQYFRKWIFTLTFDRVLRNDPSALCSVMILPFLPALEPRLDLFVIIHHPFPLSLCIISIILRVSTWLNLIHLTKKKNSHHWTEINQLPTAHLTYPLLQASHKARKRSLLEDKCGNIDCVGRNIPQVMIRHFHNAQSSERTISEGRSLSGDPITQALW